MSIFQNMRGDAVLEIRVTAVNERDGRYRRSDLYVTLAGQPLSITVTEEQQIWNALPKSVRGAVIAECEESAEPDTSEDDTDADLVQPHEEILDDRGSGPYDASDYTE